MDISIYLVPIIGFGVLIIVSVFTVISVVISMLNYKETPVRDRLMMLKGRDDYAEYSANKKSKGPFEDLKEALIIFSGPLAKSLYGANQKYLKEVKLLLTEAGKPDGEAYVWQFLAQRVALGITVGSVLFLPGLVIGGLVYGLMGFMLGGIVGLIGPQFGLRIAAQKRKAEIRFKLPDTLDLMVVCVEAGLSMDSTIQRVADETEKMAPEISYEFKRLNKEVNAGISRGEAFQSMGLRSGVEEMRSLCAMIVQADKMGTSVADTLRIFADDLRVKRRQRAEELASKASIKMTFPLILFIFPPLGIILIGPTVISTIMTFME